jgi:hypothetical protein
MQKEHYLICSAPICVDDPNPNYKDEVIWYSGEKVCRKIPYDEIQKKQLRINILIQKGKFKNVKELYTTHDLEIACI